MSAIRETETGRVLQVDFTARHGDRPTQTGRTCQLRAAPTRRTGNAKTPEAATITALAQLIAKNGDPATIDNEVDTICHLLRQRCRWTDESLSRLRTVTALARSARH